ncbi:MAG: valine--tRNA ligase [Candidatus Dependentiae bacterium]|nr:valine--tRNA ligase [Candidatus Dependentiae bacterium]
MNKQYEHSSSEAQAQQKWAAEKTYSLENNPGKLYSIDTPPPTVSGSLHIGHIFSYTQTDIIARYKRMQGFSVFYPFGFDDNGLPTERYVEKKRDVRAHGMPRSEFIKICLEETHSVEQQFVDLWQRMGLSANWENCYSTISDLARRLSQESFIKLYKKGYIYRKHEPALYCTTCRTSVAQAELDDVQKPSFFNDIVFKDAEGNNLIIGTTRPELLPSCVALLFNPDDARYQHLRGQKATVPLFDYEVPILEDEHVSIEKGTGLVMCCTFGDKTDIEWYKKFKLPYKQSITLDGKFAPETGILTGLKVPEARAKVLEELAKNNLLIGQKPITHSVNTHERCKKDIEFVALEQWFVNILDHKQKFLEMADKVDWYPAFMQARYRDWVENLSWDWCISRQRFFGIPFPAWHCKACNHIMVADITQLPIDPQETPFSGSCDKCGSTDIAPDTDVMDTWNTSSITPYIVFALYENNDKISIDDPAVHNFIPMSMRPQAHDIIRTWAFDTIVKVWMHHETIPWHNIVISGHVLSDAKEKISKSKENSPLVPENLLKTYSADVIRYWTATGSLGYDIAFSETQLKIGQRLVTKLWNAFWFTKEHITALENPKVMPKNLGQVNEWILHTVNNHFENYKKYFEVNEFGLALQPIEKFFWNDFCDNYLELIKNQLFNPELYSAEEVAATRWTLYHVGLRILQMYAPYIPHVTETIYGELYKQHEGKDSLHQTKFADAQYPFVFTQTAATMERIVALTGAVRKLKTEKQLSLKTALESLTIHVEDAAALEHLKQQEQLIKGVTQSVALVYVVGKLETAALEEKDGLWHGKVGL